MTRTPRQRLTVSLKTLASLLDADRSSVRRWLREANVKGGEAVQSYESTLKDVREKWGLGKEHAVVLTRGGREGVVVETEEQVSPMGPCPKCKQQMPTAFEFCGACGASMKDKDKKADEEDTSTKDEAPEPAADAEPAPEETTEEATFGILGGPDGLQRLQSTSARAGKDGSRASTSTAGPGTAAASLGSAGPKPGSPGNSRTPSAPRC